jgi:hypothetical protein
MPHAFSIRSKLLPYKEFGCYLYRALNDTIWYVPMLANGDMDMSQTPAPIDEPNVDEDYMAKINAVLRPHLCYGAQTSDSKPDCNGPQVQRVRVFGLSHIPFVTDYCYDCRCAARSQGATLEVLGDIMVVTESQIMKVEG